MTKKRESGMLRYAFDQALVASHPPEDKLLVQNFRNAETVAVLLSTL